jgi:hypothetical protein
VAIHRVRRSFEQTHGDNTFTAGDTDAVGLEVIVSGKGAGDRYRIKDNVVTMVHRHIHGTVVTIFTGSTMEQWNHAIRAMRDEMRQQGRIDITFHNFPLGSLTPECIRYSSTRTK